MNVNVVPHPLTYTAPLLLSPASHTIPTLFDRPEIAVNAVGEEKMVSATKCN
jgi:hypothetical protein